MPGNAIHKIFRGYFIGYAIASAHEKLRTSQALLLQVLNQHRARRKKPLMQADLAAHGADQPQWVVANPVFEHYDRVLDGADIGRQVAAHH